MNDEALWRDEFWKMVHAERGNDPEKWELMADAHLIASRKLMDQYVSIDHTAYKSLYEAPEACYLIMPALLLRGYAIEALLKAIWLWNGGKLIEDGRLVNEFANHDLAQMAGKVGNKVGFNLNDTQIALLERLSHIVRTSGRYPVSNKFEHERPIEDTQDRKRRVRNRGSWFYGPDEIMFHEILEIFHSHHGPLKFYGERP